MLIVIAVSIKQGSCSERQLSYTASNKPEPIYAIWCSVVFESKYKHLLYSVQGGIC